MTSEEMTAKAEALIEKHRQEGSSIIGLLQDVQQAFRFLPEEVLEQIKDQLDVPLSKLYGLATFYSSFRLDPIGKHHVCVCVGTACHVNGATRVAEAIERQLDIRAGETTADGEFTLETVNCLGACALGPLVVVDGEYHSKLDQKNVPKLIKKYQHTAMADI